MQSFPYRKPLGYLNRTCPWCSCAGCLKSTLFLSYTLAQLLRRICSVIFLDRGVGLTGQQYPGSSFLHILKTDTIFSFSQSLCISHDCQEFSNVMGSSLATTSVISLRTTYQERCDDRWRFATPEPRAHLEHCLCLHTNKKILA